MLAFSPAVLSAKSSRHFSLRKYRVTKSVVASQQDQVGKFQEISYISQKSELISYSGLKKHRTESDTLVVFWLFPQQSSL